MDEFFLGSSESSLVGDVEDTVVSLSVLSMDTSDLDVELVSDFFELGHFLHQLWKFNVDGSSKGGSEVGWA